ncbi:MarC family protein [bacterium M00.F.Ca.ET.228.01.1.1]|uniref:MarC family protein n=1 Tax=Paraburkholderia phenoliruptrix TaxID=252970 RepID=UPI0010919F6F|nr:MarC family protein [Paraburkholderia phenoliruptrix]MBW9101560.1 MarC family protein [Paraburkholderia phenoliruptrix]TGP44235.1 MarC family protein [bacterium M00.F.Ca.ET.228.01.1.1]TGS01898.1 MarC family protein [bacterium M00.F.Ca.ET.191.01.1.1]TGU08497.1 MarC family protein [bacterium M00.F.Ca.ET.155.01.1.1]
MEYTFLSATVLLILITDPLGNIPLFISCLRGVSPKRRTAVILREVAIAFAILLLFMVLGDAFLRMMSLTDQSLRIGGGIVLFLIALRMVFPHPDGPFGGDTRGGEPLIVPLAIPALAGPSALATVMLLTSQAPGKMFEWIGALTVTMIVCAVVLMMAERIQAWLGERTMMAFERLMGLVLVAISVEMMLGGIRAFVHHL